MHPAPGNRPQPAPDHRSGTSVDSVDVTVIIVNYNVREFLEQALRSIERASEDISTEIFVVDNNSSDGSVNMVRTRFPHVRLIANEENTGFSRANNQAIREAHGRYLLILNPDTIVREDTLQTFVRFMDDHPDAGAVGCKILNPDGTFAPESRRSFPTPAVAFYRLTGLSKFFPGNRRFGRYNMSYLSPDEETEVDALSGSCMVVRHEALLRRFDAPHSDGLNGTDQRSYDGAGLFDEDFFMYGEDLDWCYRIKESGWKIYYTPDTQIIHYKGESTKKGELRYVLLFYGAMLRFAEKHFKSRHSWLFRLFLRASIVARGSLQVVLNWFRRFAAPLRDAVVTFVMVALAGFIRFQPTDLAFPPLFIGLIAPLYAVATVFSVSALGGYSLRNRARLLPVIYGSVIAFSVMGAVFFFAKTIAFSRLATVLSFILSLSALCLMRMASAHRRQPGLFRRALLVGNRQEVRRLQQLQSTLPISSLEILGYVGEEPPQSEDETLEIPFIATPRHLRDVVRLHEIDDVIFASSVLSNRTIFDLIQQLRDLPVAFKILSPNLEHLISPARVDDLTAPPALIDAERALGIKRSTFSRRAFELFFALGGMLIHPIFMLAALPAGKHSWLHALVDKTGRLPSVLSGRRALVGYREEEASFIGESWHLKPGVFTITDTLPPQSTSSQDIGRTYWLYVCNQSLTLDLDIIFRSIKQMRAQNAGSQSSK